VGFVELLRIVITCNNNYYVLYYVLSNMYSYTVPVNSAIQCVYSYKCIFVIIMLNIISSSFMRHNNITVTLNLFSCPLVTCRSKYLSYRVFVNNTLVTISIYMFVCMQ